MYKPNGRATAAVLATLALTATGCGGVAPSDSPEPTTNGEPLYGLLDPGAQAGYWNNVEGQGVVIPVCWTANALAGRGTDGVLLGGSFPGVANAQAWTRYWAETTWGRVANIVFTGWGDQCVASGTGDDDDRALNPGKIMLAFLAVAGDDGVWHTDINGKSPLGGTMIRINRASTTRDAYHYPAVHEFGHALGFAHEQQRPDNWSGSTPLTCVNFKASELGGSPGGTNYTTWVDKQSVMCYDTTTGVLSPGDIMGIQKRYGRKPTGSIVGFNGMCVNISGASTADNAPVGPFPCTGSWNDTFFRPNNTFENLQTPINSRCLNVQGGKVGGPLVGWSCLNSSSGNERFVFGTFTNTGAGAEWRALGNLCVQMSGGHPQVATCDGSDVQRWVLQRPNGTVRLDQIRDYDSGNCLTTTTTTGVLGERLTLAACSATDVKQRFTYPGGGVIKMANNPNLCLNVSGGLPIPGSEIGLWDGCNLSPPPQNEQFHVHGTMKSLGACVRLNSNNTITDEACNLLSLEGESPLWDYYL